MDFYNECKQDVSKHSSLKVDALLRELSKDDRKSLLEALKDTDIPTRSIARVLEQSGYRCGRWAVGEWRKHNGVEARSSRGF